MRVIAIDGGKEKEELCKKLGAEEYIDFMTCKDIKAEVMRITTYGGGFSPLFPLLFVGNLTCWNSARSCSDRRVKGGL